MVDKKKENLPISFDMLKALAKFQEIEFEDVELSFDELELRISPGMITGPPAVTPSQGIINNIKPTQIQEEKVGFPSHIYNGEVVEVRLGATKADGGTRDRSFVIGGETAPAFYNFQAKTPNRPIIAMDVFDWEKIPLAKAVKMHFREVVADPAAWAKMCVEKYDADMINLHMLTIDPLIEDASPKSALKTMEDVLEAVDVPIAFGGCGDPKKDLEVFKVVAEATAGERILFNSVTLDMDIKATADIIRENGHTVIAFTSMDVNKARELNRKLYDFLPKEDILMDTTTAALGYGLDYAYTVMERSRLAALKGDPELNHPISSGATNAWAAREAWMKMGAEWAPRELRGPIWETITAQTLLMAGVDYFMMMHPAAVRAIKTLINNLMSGKDPSDAQDWVSLKL
ncbi:MAG: CO dehydrogenase/acetyl-CoA synthase subunit delta [Candidatus Bathyarchaeota archaeon]|jgi:acetyl-CoA decarbonylase/synthase complex subunit delta|nr:CO dehydrogenase/acetyl-CoA synthase subunit delta [Candidatus Bathyarchaeota archaeon]